MKAIPTIPDKRVFNKIEYIVSVYRFDEEFDGYSTEVEFERVSDRQLALSKFNSYADLDSDECASDSEYSSESEAYDAGLEYLVTIRQYCPVADTDLGVFGSYYAEDVCL